MKKAIILFHFLGVELGYFLLFGGFDFVGVFFLSQMALNGYFTSEFYFKN